MSQTENREKVKNKENKTQETEEDKDWRNTIDWEFIYKCIVGFVLLLVPFFVRDMINFRRYCDENGLQYQSIMFIPYAFVAAGVLTIYRNVICYNLFYNVAIKYMDPKFQGLDREVRAKKVIKWGSDVIYYTATTVYACIFFRHKSWFPLTLQKENWYDPAIFLNHPDKIQDDVTFYVDLFMIVQFGQHIYALLELIIVRRKTDNKFYEWLLHHVLAVTLIFYSVFNNFFIPGILILVLHDIGDIFLAWFKVYGVFKTDTLFYINTFNMIISWFISRIYVYPKGVILPCISYYQNYLGVSKLEYKDHVQACYIYLLCLISILFLMHVYWFATMLTMLGNHLKKIVKKSKPVKFQNDFDFHQKNLDKKSK